MITSMHIENFKCFKDFDIELGPFNVLIGPNDSGKSTFLQAVDIVSACSRGGSLDSNGLRTKTRTEIGPFFKWNGEPEISISINFKGVIGNYDQSSWVVFDNSRQIWGVSGSKAGSGISQEQLQAAQRIVGKAEYFHLIPSELRKPSPIQQSAKLILNTSGGGFPTFLEDFLRDDRHAFQKMEEEFYKRFPDYKILLPKEGNTNVLKFKDKIGNEIPNENISDGAMLFLAFLAITHQVNPPEILLVEEPENGVHPGRLESIVEFLKNISKEKTQVILTTHSPYLLDYVNPEDIRVFLKDDVGAVYTVKLSDYPEVEEMRKHFGSGEIWTAFDEKKIVETVRGEK